MRTLPPVGRASAMTEWRRPLAFYRWQVDTGHIGGTSAWDLPGSVENCRDLSRSSGSMPVTSAEVRSTPAQDPAYRPTCLPGRSVPLTASWGRCGRGPTSVR
jgi:hypothetical protein